MDLGGTRLFVAVKASTDQNIFLCFLQALAPLTSQELFRLEMG